MTPTVSLSVAALTIDSADPAALADFWGNSGPRRVLSGWCLHPWPGILAAR
jgi:hypothetical protein